MIIVHAIEQRETDRVTLIEIYKYGFHLFGLIIAMILISGILIVYGAILADEGGTRAVRALGGVGIFFAIVLYTAGLAGMFYKIISDSVVRGLKIWQAEAGKSGRLEEARERLFK